MFMIILQPYERADGTKEWWLNGELHRTDGPAVEEANGTKEWWLNGELYTKNDYYKELMKLGLITEKEGFLEML
jgi:hypothetical protein